MKVQIQYSVSRSSRPYSPQVPLVDQPDHKLGDSSGLKIAGPVIDLCADFNPTVINLLGDIIYGTKIFLVPKYNPRFVLSYPPGTIIADMGIDLKNLPIPHLAAVSQQ